jgi:glucose/arabinose dehydrogenase
MMTTWTRSLPLASAALVASLIASACEPRPYEAGLAASLTPRAGEWGEVVLGAVPRSRSFELRAGTVGALELKSVRIEGPFRHDLSAGVLDAGERRTFRVWFEPTQEGRQAGRLELRLGGAAGTLQADLAGTARCQQPSAPIFTASTLANTALDSPTSLQFGPDGRLYVAQLDGRIAALQVVRVGKNAYRATAMEAIDLIQQIPNHDDNGVAQPSLTGRMVTGMLVTGTPALPVIYAVSCDPRLVHGQDSGLDTNSGVLSRLWRGAGTWQRLDLVRGLPRSEEAHVSNGLVLDPDGSRLYLCQGGHTNMGAPSSALGALPEYALSAAILSIDLQAIGATTYDLPTLDDEDRPGNPDAGDPFGGNNGKNQARLVSGGPVQVHSSGWRNPYDLTVTQAGRMYAFDNGANAGWGNLPLDCTNALNDAPSAVVKDQLHWISSGGFYAGHPNPTRGDMGNTFNSSLPQSPVGASHPIECQWLEPTLPPGMGGDGNLALVNASCTGICEYTTDNFQGALEGQLLVACGDRRVRRVRLSPDGASALEVEVLFTNAANFPLDLTAQGPGGPFPGTIWLGDFELGMVRVFEPVDYEFGCFGSCTGTNSWTLDEDGDGFKNADELLNTTNPCSAADVPPDADGDFLSDLVDPDDDNDDLSDVQDAFALDSTNGQGTTPPLHYTWAGGQPGTGLFGLGFTGLMANGTSDYLTMFDPQKQTAGGAAGMLTLEYDRFFSAVGSFPNEQHGSFQFGVQAAAAGVRYAVQTRVLAPFFNGLPAHPVQSQGLFAGTGTVHDFLRVVLASGPAPGRVEVGLELGDVYQASSYPLPWMGSSAVDLRLEVDPLLGRIRPRAAVDGGPFVDLGGDLSLPAGSPLFQAIFGPGVLAVGLAATSDGATSFVATWDGLEVWFL